MREKNKSADSAGVAAMHPNTRTRVGNGSSLHDGVDGRSHSARRWKEVYTDALSRTGGAQVQLCRSLASAVVQRERMDSALARGEEIDAGVLIRLCGAISRLMTKLGLDEPTPGPLPADAPSWLVGPRAPSESAP